MIRRGVCKGAIPVSLLLLWILFPLSARAVAAQTFLGLETDATIALGVQPTVTVRLTGAAGPLAGAALEIQLDGRQTKRLVTDGDGRATTVLARDLDAGDYAVQAVFRGTPDLLASVSAVTIIHVTPVNLTVRTVPPVANIPLLRIDGGRTLTTGADGTIRIPITSVRRYQLEVTLPPADPDRQLTFDRWSDGSREPSRSIRLPGRTDLVIGLTVSYRVAFAFLDSTGAAVDPARIETLLIANGRGDVVQPADRTLEWLIGNQIIREAGGLTSVPIEYRIQEVAVRGSSVVDRGRLHFRPDGEIATWTIPLALYSLTLYGQDALFGYALGSSVQLVYPNGTAESVPLDASASTTISALPRGNYKAVIEHPPGIPVQTPLVLSRDQRVRVPVISYVDAGFVLGAGLTLSVTLVLYGGRPVGRVGRRALRRVVGAPVTMVRAPAAMARRTSRAIGSRYRWKPAPSLRTLGGLDFALLVPMQIGAAASVEISNDEPVDPALAHRDIDRWGRSIERERRHQHCPDCRNRLTPRARLCRVCGRRMRRS